MSDDTETEEFRARAAVRRRTWGMTRFANLDAMKDAEYLFWSVQPAHVKVAAISGMTTEAYATKGVHVHRLPRPHRAADKRPS